MALARLQALARRWLDTRAGRALKAVARLLWRGWLLLPISVVGLAVAGTSWWAYQHYAEGQSDFVLHTASVVGLAVTGASVVFVLLGALGLLWSLRHAELGVEQATQAGVEVETALKLSRLAWWPLIQVEARWTDPERVEVRLEPERGRFREWVTFSERGRIRSVERRFTVSDIFGLARLSFHRRANAGLHVAPAEAQADLRLAIRHAGGDGYSHPEGEPIGEMIEMRRYTHGDPLRFVLWKTYARTRQLLVRTPERAIAPQPSTVAYFVAGEGDEPTASTARAFLEHDLLGPDFVFMADGARQTVENDPRAALEAIIDSAHYRDRGGEGLPALLAEVDTVKLSNCVLFVPGRPGPWLDRVVASASKLPVPPTIVVGVDGALEVQDRMGRLGRLLFAPAKVDRTLGELPALHEKLATLRGPVRVVHKSSGRMLQPAELDALRELA